MAEQTIQSADGANHDMAAERMPPQALHTPSYPGLKLRDAEQVAAAVPVLQQLIGQVVTVTWLNVERGFSQEYRDQIYGRSEERVYKLRLEKADMAGVSGVKIADDGREEGPSFLEYGRHHPTQQEYESYITLIQDATGRVIFDPYNREQPSVRS